MPGAKRKPKSKENPKLLRAFIVLTVLCLHDCMMSESSALGWNRR